MSFSNIRSFIHTLKRENELAVIEAEVDPYLEIAEIHRRVIEEGGPALLFTNVKGSPFSVATNLFGTTRRVDMAFGPRPEQFANKCIEAVNRFMPPSPKKLWEERSLVKELLGLLKVGMKDVSSAQAPIMDVKRTDMPMKGLPALTSWQLDGGRSLPSRSSTPSIPHARAAIITWECTGFKYTMTRRPESTGRFKRRRLPLP